MCRWRKEEYECRQPFCQHIALVNERKIVNYCEGWQAWREKHISARDEDYDTQNCTWDIKDPDLKIVLGQEQGGPICRECYGLAALTKLTTIHSQQPRDELDEADPGAQLDDAPQSWQTSAFGLTGVPPANSSACLASQPDIPATMPYHSDAARSTSLSRLPQAQSSTSIDADSSFDDTAKISTLSRTSSAGGDFSRQLPHPTQATHTILEPWDLGRRHQQQSHAAAYAGISDWVRSEERKEAERSEEYLPGDSEEETIGRRARDRPDNSED